MSSEVIENKTVRKNYARQSTRSKGPGRPTKNEKTVYIQTGFSQSIYEKLSTLAKRKGINESDIIRLTVANALESLSL